MQSAHTDIGYTHPQEQIALMYLEHYDRVLDLCRASAAAPASERFKWVCETFWQVQHYLRHRPEREAEFLHFVRNGQIEITAAYLHFTDLIDADAYARSVQLAVDYCRTHQLPLRTAMHCDINGWPWAMADLLAQFDIPYFCSQVHMDSGTDPLGQRGSVHYHWLLEWGDALRPDVPVRVPQAFWWHGPRGGRVLHWLNEHYLLGNVLGVSSHQPFSADKTRYFLETDTLSTEALYQRAQHELPIYLARLHQQGYRYPAMLLSTGGFYVDNAPPDSRWLEVIRRWNAEHSDVQLRTATLSEWFDALTAMSSDFPTHQVAWPDHWAHGLGSTTARIAQARRTQRRRADAVALVEQANSAQAAAHLAAALEHERLSLEHTFNAWSTTARPEANANAFQNAVKETTFHRAELYLDEAIGTALRAVTQPSGTGSGLFVHGTGGDDVRTLLFESGDQALDPARHALADVAEHAVAFQRDHPSLPHFVAATVLPAGLSRFQVADGAAAPTATATASTTLQSAHWTIAVDPHTGALRSLRHHSGREWVDLAAAHGFGQLVHTAVVHPHGRNAVGNEARIIQLDVASERVRQNFAEGPIVATSVPQVAGDAELVAGPVFDELVMWGESARIGRVRIAWRSYHALPLIELVLDWNKHWCDQPEAAYVAFPFAVSAGQLELETSGGFFTPGTHTAGGQLAGTCSSYYTIQRAATVRSEADTLVWAPLDAPLVMTNAIDYNRWETTPYQWNGLLASMPVNHYWHTNFQPSQRGDMRLRYRLVSASDYATLEAAIVATQPVDALGWR
jgi:hypothetical protein